VTPFPADGTRTIPKEGAVKILLADDHPLFREGVKPMLQKLDRKVELVEAFDYPSAFEAMRRAGEVDLALIDLFMPGMSGIEGVARFRAAFPDIPLVVLSASDQREDIQQLFAAGALGFVNKSAPREVILGALREVLAGGVYVPPNLLDPEQDEPPRPNLAQYPTLTSRQIEVLRELASGGSNRQIGEALGVTEGTVKIHMAAIFRILKVNNRTEAVLVAQKMGLKKPD
jgi:DNA-binding NarL/FixJ family response regulator